MGNADQGPVDIGKLGKPFDPYPTIRVFSSPDVFKKNLSQSGLASVANELAGDMSTAWEKGVFDALTSLSSMRNYAARCVLTEIDWYGKRKKFNVFILPRDMKGELEIWASQPDPKLTPEERVIKAWLNASSQGRAGMPGPGMIADASKNQPGDGDNALVRYDPLIFDPDNTFREVADQMYPGRYGPYGASPAEALLHELVHAMRTLKGITDPLRLGPPINDSFEEFVAVLVTNIHTAEQNPGGLRAGHTGFMPMQPNLATSLGFLSDKNNSDLVKYLIRQDRSFCNNLSQTVYLNSFNPILMLLKPIMSVAN